MTPEQNHLEEDRMLYGGDWEIEADWEDAIVEYIERYGHHPDVSNHPLYQPHDLVVLWADGCVSIQRWGEGHARVYRSGYRSFSTRFRFMNYLRAHPHTVTLVDAELSYPGIYYRFPRERSSST